MTKAEAVPFFTDPTGREHPLASKTTSIGRGVENDLVITSKRVSREHARVRRRGRRVILTDLGSTNGTFLNEKRLVAAVELRDGDRVCVGDVDLVFHDPESTHLETPFPDLEIDTAAGIVRLDQRVIALSPREFALLAYLHQRAGQICSKDDRGRGYRIVMRERVS